jgi:Icc-related predicted phosphoesterase
MLAILGDIHGDFYMLQQKVDQAIAKGASALIQVGDFGYYKHLLDRLWKCELDIPVYWIDGNHEEHEHLQGITDILEIHNNCFFVPRGKILELDNRVIAFMGGAASIDKGIRLRKKLHWTHLENIMQSDLDNLLNNLKLFDNKVDMMISHVPPQGVISRNFTKNVFKFFGVPNDWKDENADIIESIWNNLGKPQLYCGHMHISVSDGNCQILDINEVIYV